MKAWASQTRWQRLEVLNTDRGGESDTEGVVEFKAWYLDPQGKETAQLSQTAVHSIHLSFFSSEKGDKGEHRNKGEQIKGEEQKEEKQVANELELGRTHLRDGNFERYP